MMYDAPYKLTTNSMSPTIHNLVHISTWETIIVRYDPSSWIGAPPLIIMHASFKKNCGFTFDPKLDYYFEFRRNSINAKSQGTSTHL